MENNPESSQASPLLTEIALAPVKEHLYRLVIDNLPLRLFVKDLNHTYVLANRPFTDGLGLEPQQVVGKTDLELFPKNLAERYRAEDTRVLSEGAPITYVETYTENGKERTVRTTKSPVRDASGRIIGILGIFSDITKQRLAEEAQKRAEDVIRQQTEEIMELSTPVVQIWDGVLAVPLIGTLDTQRAQQVTEQLLQGIVETRSAIALIDITGVPAVDTQTARHLTETVTAVRLLGAQAILTGIRPVIAQTLVHLGVDLGGIVTRPTLASGLQIALDILGLQVLSKERPR